MRGRLRLRARQGGVQLARLWEAAPAAHGSRARCYRHLGSQWGTWGDHSSPSGLRFAMEWLQILQGKCKFHVLGGYENIGLGEAKSWCRRLCESQAWLPAGQLLPRAVGRWGTGADCAASSCCQWLRAPADTRMVPLCHPWCPSSSLHVKDMAFSLQRSQRISSMRYIRNDERVPGALSQPVHPNSRITPYCQAPAFRSRELEARQGECSC